MPALELVTDLNPAGDQPAAIAALSAGIERGDRFQTLLGVTGSGKTMSVAHVIKHHGRPTLVIFGPTNPLTTRPFAPVAEILRHPPDCAPCMLRDCPIDHRCMTAITVDEVFEHSHALLKRISFARTVRSLCDSVA